MKTKEKGNLKNKSGDWLLKKYEDGLKGFLLPRVPAWLQTYHLTMLTFVWIFGVFFSFYFGKDNFIFLFGVSVFVIFQYLTDLLDGAVGRYRNTGLIKWGYYADHFLDFFFMSSIIFGYGLVLGFSAWIFLLEVIMAGAMVHTFLLVSANEFFNISFLKIGPTESRLFFIVFHAFFAVFGIYKLNLILPYLVTISALVLLIAFLKSQEELWKQDMLNKYRQ